VTPLTAHLLYALAWASFGAGHSALATAGGRAVLERYFGAGHRIAYNIIAAVHIAAVVAVGHWVLDPLPAFALPRALSWTLSGMSLLGLAAGIWSLRYYDTGRLLGTAQLRHPAAPEDEPLRLDGPHRYVRHPLYASGFLILWGLAQDHFGLATAVWGSAYLVIGSRFEERKLLRLYGQAYADYRRRVPAFVPWRGRL